MSLPNPHDYTRARRVAEHLRSEAVDEFWRGADAVLDRVCLNARARLARSTQRLQARLRRHRVSAAPGQVA
ncbi:hypothetical protein [Hydrogenophaga sp.]|uniref:hypothetical protein n=1 Tax=Hydrogenophaga sp. TaxID=1904254 RepID=UPI002FC6633F